MSLKKWPPAIILIKPSNKPATKLPYRKIIFLYGSFIAGLVLGLIRIMAGGHFLSDIFFAGFFIVILNIILFELYKKYYVK